MGQQICVVDAFADGPFSGNPAAVCVMGQPAPEAWMQHVAAEMTLSETAFLHPSESGYGLRWFTPSVEVDLCGHATLASAHVLFETGLLSAHETARFETRSGLLTVSMSDGLLEMDLPASTVEACAAPDGLLEALGVPAHAVYRTKFDYLVDLDSEADVLHLQPDFARLRNIDVRGVMATAPSAHPGVDFVSRFFAPGSGIDEDPVTGSAHCALGPFWGGRLGKDEMVARQVSRRGGTLRVRLAGDRVKIGGNAVTVWRGELSEAASRGMAHGTLST